MNSQIKTLFIGSGIFAVEILTGLLKNPSVDLVGIITQPDKPVGRNQDLAESAVGEFAKIFGLSKTALIFKPEKLKLDADEILNQTRPDLIIVADYGQMIPETIINYPKFKCLNVHGSLLPDLRGAVPIPIAILRGYNQTGVSIPIMTTGLDDGDVLASEEIEIAINDTAETLKQKLAHLGSALLNDTLLPWTKGKLIPVKQDDSNASITWRKDIAKDQAEITLSTNALQAERMIRAFYSWPIAWCRIQNHDGSKILRLKIIQAELADELTFVQLNHENQEILFERLNKELFMVFPDLALKLIKVQPEGKKIIKGSNMLFLAGYRFSKN